MSIYISLSRLVFVLVIEKILLSNEASEATYSEHKRISKLAAVMNMVYCIKILYMMEE